MAVLILHGPTAAALAVATSQQAQCEAVISAWAGGNVRARIYAGAVLLRTLTIGPWTINTAASPRKVVAATGLADTAVAAGVQTRVVFELLDGTPVFECSAGATASGADINWQYGQIRALCKPTMAVELLSDPLLPDALPPAWLSAPVGEWAQISGVALNSSTANYGGLALRDDGDRVELCEALAGGHTSGQWLTDNRVRTLRLDVNVPAWVQRRGPSDATGWDTTGITSAYFADGRPVPRHTYVHAHWSPRYAGYLFGGAFSGVNADGATPGHELFVPSGDTGGDWLLQSDPSRLANRPSTHYFMSAVEPTSQDGCLFYSGNAYKWNSAADTYTAWTLTGDAVTLARGGSAIDTRRNAVVQIGGNGWYTQAGAGSPGIRAVRVDWSTGVKTAITFNASAGKTDFEAVCPYFTGTSLVYDAEADLYYLYNGNTGSPVLTGQGAKVYKITPRDSLAEAWDIEVMAVTGVTPAAEPNNSGSYDKLKWVPRWKTLILGVSSQLPYYLRVR